MLLCDPVSSQSVISGKSTGLRSGFFWEHISGAKNFDLSKQLFDSFSIFRCTDLLNFKESL